jgi:hypothetical protein
VVVALPLVYVLEEMEPFIQVDAALVDVGDSTLVDLIIDDRVSMGSALDLPSPLAR